MMDERIRPLRNTGTDALDALEYELIEVAAGGESSLSVIESYLREYSLLAHGILRFAAE